MAIPVYGVRTWAGIFEIRYVRIEWVVVPVMNDLTIRTWSEECKSYESMNVLLLSSAITAEHYLWIALIVYPLPENSPHMRAGP